MAYTGKNQEDFFCIFILKFKLMKYTLLILLTWQSLHIFGQDAVKPEQKTDFSQNKNFVGISANLWSPVIANNKYPDFNVYKDGKVVPGKDRLDWGIRLDYFRKVSRRFSIGLETGLDFFSIHRNSMMEASVSEYYYIYDYENLDVISGTIMPKVRFSFKPGRFPEIVQQLGIGVKVSNKISKTYHYDLSTRSNPYPSTEPDYETSYPTIEYDYVFEKRENIAVTGMYSFSLLSQLNSRLSVQYGVRFTYNYIPVPSHYSEKLYEPYYSNTSPQSFAFYLNRRLQNAFFQANVGLIYAF